MKSDTMEARGTLMLLGEEIGVHIPRHLQTMLAEIPGVGAALSAAFSSVAVLALIEILVKVIQKVAEWRAEAEASRQAWAALGVETQKSSDALRVANDQLEISIAKLRGMPTGGLMLKSILDEARKAADDLADSLDKDSKKMDELLKKSSVGFFAKVFEDQSGIDDVQEAVKKLHEDVKGVADEEARQLSISTSTAMAEKIREESAVKIQALYAATNTQLQGMLSTSTEIQKRNEASANLPMGGSQFGPVMQRTGYDDQTDRIKALNLVTTQLGKDAEQTGLSETHLGLALTEHVAKGADDARKAFEAAQKAMENMRASVASLIEKFELPVAPWQKTEEEADKAEQQIRKMASDNPALFKKAFPNDSIDTVVEAMRKMAAQVEDKQFQTGILEMTKNLNSLPKKFPDLPAVVPVMPTLAADHDVMGTAAMELQKITTNATAANAEAVKIIDSIQTQNQKFTAQVAILDELKTRGLLTQKEYAVAFKQAEDASEKMSKEWQKFAKEISSTVVDALSFKTSWGDALKTILGDFLKIIVQMELMKALGKSGAGGGGGGVAGFLGALFGGGKAAGGPVDASHAYLVGEHGPELFAPHGAGTIIPPGHTAAMLQPNVTYNHYQNVTTPDADSFRKSSAQLGADAYEAMTSSHARNR